MFFFLFQEKIWVFVYIVIWRKYFILGKEERKNNGKKIIILWEKDKFDWMKLNEEREWLDLFGKDIKVKGKLKRKIVLIIIIIILYYYFIINYILKIHPRSVCS